MSTTEDVRRCPITGEQLLVKEVVHATEKTTIDPAFVFSVSRCVSDNNSL